MGNWTINIEGTGPHHNKQDFDADEIAREAVRTLRAKGHTVEHATITASGRDNLLPGIPAETEK